MKYIASYILALGLLVTIASCEKDEGKLPNISFKTGSTYLSKDTTVKKGVAFTIGIKASKSEKEDVLKKFNISKSTAGGSAGTVYSKDLSGSEKDNYEYDYAATADTVVGESTYTFTVTNRDGLINQVSLKLTVQ